MCTRMLELFYLISRNNRFLVCFFPLIVQLYQVRFKSFCCDKFKSLFRSSIFKELDSIPK